jgi:hypothetical protein
MGNRGAGIGSYGTVYDHISLRLLLLIWNVDGSNSDITNYLTTTNFMYAVCGLNNASQCKQDLKM